MKVRPTENYLVRVVHQEWEELPECAPHYAGVFSATLNHSVHISFVPDLSDIAPPWDPGLVPTDFDAIDTSRQARMATVYVNLYVVTPNASLAGTEEWVDWPPRPSGLPSTLIFYVTPEEFERYAADLDGLAEESDEVVADLRDHEVIVFIERRIVASGFLAPPHAELLGQRR
jgi:hypothetical protein